MAVHGKQRRQPFANLPIWSFLTSPALQRRGAIRIFAKEKLVRAILAGRPDQFPECGMYVKRIRGSVAMSSILVEFCRSNGFMVGSAGAPRWLAELGRYAGIYRLDYRTR
ncbi:hypothetical protein Dimus_019871 [Dionaea muscipula]